MKMYIAIIAVCASTLVLAQADAALAREKISFEAGGANPSKVRTGTGAGTGASSISILRGGRETEDSRSQKRSGGKSGQQPSGYIGNVGWGQRGK